MTVSCRQVVVAQIGMPHCVMDRVNGGMPHCVMCNASLCNGVNGAHVNGANGAHDLDDQGDSTLLSLLCTGSAP